MKYLSFLVPVLLFASCVAPVKNNNVSIGKIDSLYSKVLGEERHIMVSVPDGPPDSKVKYPILYLLDGDAHFSSVVGMIEQLSSVNGNDICPKMIIVGIPNTDRTRDLTPTHATVGADGKKVNFFGSSGGGEKFTTFIEKELMPHIDSLYPVAPYKVLIGHSFGGLTAMNILVHHPEMFNSYVAIDPSMWWDNRKLLNQAKEVFKQKNYRGKSLYLGIANTMPLDMDTLQARIDTTGNTGHIRSILALKDVLKSNTADGLKFAYAYYKEDNHGSVPLITEYDALHFLFSFYGMPKDIQDKLRDEHSTIDPAAAFSDHYAEVSEHMGYKMLPPEQDINGLGYQYLQTGKKDAAYKLFALNIKNYPESWNVYDSMGDYYNSQKDKVKAIEYFSKALKLHDNPDSKKKLEELQKKK